MKTRSIGRMESLLSDARCELKAMQQAWFSESQEPKL